MTSNGIIGGVMEMMLRLVSSTNVLVDGIRLQRAEAIGTRGRLVSALTLEGGTNSGATAAAAAAAASHRTDPGPQRRPRSVTTPTWSASESIRPLSPQLGGLDIIEQSDYGTLARGKGLPDAAAAAAAHPAGRRHRSLPT
jgi:hypothetical protein